MTKRIFRSICLVAIAVFLASLVLIMGVLYEYFSGAQRELLRAQTELAAQGVETSGIDYFPGLDTEGCRLTWIAADGSVIYDTSSDAAAMENHLDREEVQQALETGYGLSQRYSKTLTEQMLYSAQRLSDGSVLRVSSTQYTVVTILAGLSRSMIIIVAAAVAVSFFLATRLSKGIVRPLNELDLDKPALSSEYDEIRPLLDRIESQQRQLRAQEAELKRRQDEFTAASENMAEGIVLLNEKGLILSINPAATRLLSISDYCIGRDILMLNSSLGFQQLLSRARAGQHAEMEMDISGLGYQINASPVFSDGRVAGIVLLIFDVTEKEKAEKMRREFTANVSHELKTPLHSISGYAELMKSGMVKPEDIKGFAGHIYTEAQRMISLVDDIIKLSHLDEGAQDMPSVDFDLYTAAQDVIRSLTPEAEKMHVSLELTGGSAVISGVPPLLSGVIYNLCENAIKYNREYGSVTVNIADRPDKAVLTVSDTGIGIDKEHQERIFERFYRVDKSRSKEVGGTGLGLSIVKHACRLHDAQIKLDSVPGAGTTVTVTFPKTKPA